MKEKGRKVEEEEKGKRRRVKRREIKGEKIKVEEEEKGRGLGRKRVGPYMTCA